MPMVQMLLEDQQCLKILKDNVHIEEVAKYIGTIPYEIMCNITKRVDRVYEGESLI